MKLLHSLSQANVISVRYFLNKYLRIQFYTRGCNKTPPINVYNVTPAQRWSVTKYFYLNSFYFSYFHLSNFMWK